MDGVNNIKIYIDVNLLSLVNAPDRYRTNRYGAPVVD